MAAACRWGSAPRPAASERQVSPSARGTQGSSIYPVRIAAGRTPSAHGNVLQPPLSWDTSGHSGGQDQSEGKVSACLSIFLMEPQSGDVTESVWILWVFIETELWGDNGWTNQRAASASSTDENIKAQRREEKSRASRCIGATLRPSPPAPSMSAFLSLRLPCYVITAQGR